MPFIHAKVARGDQATRLREMAHRRRTPAMTIAVTSGKGGVGKSNVAVNLAICLAARQQRVTLVDADMGLANADLLMDVQPRYTLSHVISGVRSIEDVLTTGPGGIRFVAGASGYLELANLSLFERQNLIAQLEKLKTSTDILILDCGAGIGVDVMAFAMAADRVVVVTTPEPTALTDAYATLKTLHRERCAAQLCLLVNMVKSRSEAASVYERIAKVANSFLNYSVADYGYLLQDTAVVLAVRQRCPFVIRYPESHAAACISAVASEVSRMFAGRRERVGVLSRVAGLFV